MRNAIPILALLLVTGCQAHRNPIDTDVSAAETVHFDPAGVKVLQPVPGQRFTPTTSVLVSYDTQTGQICRTYGWGGSVDETGIYPCEWLANQHPPEKGK